MVFGFGKKITKEDLKHMESANDVKGLNKALKHKYYYIREAAAYALLKIGDNSSVKPLIKALNDDYPDVREAAIKALGKIGDSRAVKPLIKKLDDEKFQTEAAKALGEIGDVRAVEPLIKRLNSHNRYLPEAAANALGEIGDARAVEPLIISLTDDNYNAKYALMKMGDSAVEPLIKALNDENSTRRKYAAEVLGGIRDSRAVKPLTIALNDPNEDVLLNAVRALGEIGAPSESESLIKMLESESWSVRSEASSALNKLGWKPEKNVIGANYWIGQKKWDKVVEIGEPAVKPLMKELESENYTKYEAAIIALDKLGWKPEKNVIGANYWIEKEQWDKVVEIGEPAVDPLIRRLESRRKGPKDDEKRVRTMVAKSLAEIGEITLEPLLETLKYGDLNERDGAGDALELLYKQNKISADAKRKILSHKDEINQKHTDKTHHEDCAISSFEEHTDFSRRMIT